MSVTLRAAQAGDASALAGILQDWVDATPWFPNLHNRAEDLAFISGLIRDQQVTLADLTQTAVGFIAHSAGFISCLYVLGAHRGQGIGRALLETAKSGASGPLKLWTFQANAGARRFYLREGFVETGRTPGNNEERLPDVELTWQGALS